MKIGIITFHCAYNFGSALQTWALKKQLENMGNIVQVVDYRGNDFDKYKLMYAPNPRQAIVSSVCLIKNIKRRSAFESFINREFNCTERFTTKNEAKLAEIANQFDCFICGSDQIWNLDCTNGPVPPYFLSFAGTARRIAYAPSLSHMSFQAEHFTDYHKRLIKEWLSRFEALSVREESTINLFQPLTSTEIQTCLDPTLLLSADDYSSIIAPVEGVRGKLFVYMLERNETLLQYASNLAELMDVDIAYISRRRLAFEVCAENYYGVGPAEFLGIIRDAKAVLTNSFHATVFSLLFGKPFQTFVTQRSGIRMVEFLEKVGASDRLTDGKKTTLPAAASKSLVNSRLELLRGQSRSFLERALGE